jgi:2-polyprenyl-6-methoxyphenol hydroxylase-like FAD-dependent oxidoreductase
VKEVPVIITGGGSVGLSLAAELGWRGIECLVVEQSDGLNPHPRANAVANRTMEYYRRWGIDKAITDAGVPPDHLADYYWVSSLHGNELHRISLPPFKKIKEVKDNTGYVKEEHTWSPYLKTITGQNEVEKAILDYVQTLEQVDFRFGWKLLGFEQNDQGVICELMNLKTNDNEVVQCQYLLACDGGRSEVREKLDIGLSGRANLAQFVSIYFKAPDLMNCHKFGPANIFFPLHKDYAGFILNWDGGTTFTYHLMLKDNQEWDSVDPVAAIEAVLGASTPIEIISTQPWTAHALVAEQYHKGRVFLSGDAVHLFTPTGGFGMNTGVSDAIDLAWKVQAMLEGWGGNQLLESYFSERHPIGIRNTTEAADCFDRLDAVMKYGDELDEEGSKGDAFRSKLGIDLKEQEKLISSSGTLLGYRYEGSPIVIPDGTTEPADNPRTYIPVARPGHRAPHIWLDEGVSLLDKLGSGFTFLVFDDLQVNLESMREAATATGLPLKIIKIDDADAANLYERKFVIIRPDLMVAWRSNHLPENPPELFDILRGETNP